MSEVVRLPRGARHPIVDLLGWRDDVNVAISEVLGDALLESPPSPEKRLAGAILEHEIRDEPIAPNHIKRALRASM